MIKISLGLGNEHQKKIFTEKMATIAVRIGTEKAKDHVEEAQKKLMSEVKKGYMMSNAYNIRLIKDSTLKSRKKNKNRNSLFDTGQLMKSVSRSPIKVIKFGNWGQSYSFNVFAKNSVRTDSKKTNKDLAEIHEKGFTIKRGRKRIKVPPRPLWENVVKNNLPQIMDELINDIKTKL